MNELGEWLASAREARGLTLEDAERDTRISRRYLQALESGDLDVIPAPVYARGFLRSYSQYLGLDPQEAMARYPRDDGPPGYAPPPQAGRSDGRNQRRQAAPPPDGDPFGSASVPPPQGDEERPPWRRPGPGAVPAAEAPPRNPAPRRRPEPEPAYYPDEVESPTIGVDIGVPVPARRLRNDPAAQTRSMVVLAIAGAAIIVILAIAFGISRLGAEDDASVAPPGDGESEVSDTVPGVSENGSDQEDLADTGESTPSTGGETAASGVVPEVQGETEAVAVEAIRAAGLEPNVRYEPSEGTTPGIVLTQAPAAGTEREAGEFVTIIVSEEP